MQGAPLADEPGQALCSTAAGNKSERDFGLAEFRGFHRDPDGARHRRLAAAAEGEAIDGRDHRLAEILDEVEHPLSEPARLLGFESGDMSEFADVRAGDERFVAGSREDDAANFSVVPRIFEGGPQVLPCRRIQGVEHTRPIDRHIRDRILLFIQDIGERHRRRW